MTERRHRLRPDLAAIASLVPAGSRVLDVGCSEGDLLEYLAHERNVDGRGIELSQQKVNACVGRGLSVVQGDADTDLADYPSSVFDVVILSQTIQATRSPRGVLCHLLRIAERTIVSFPNFGHWQIRLALLMRGRMPKTTALCYRWYDTPNIHLCTITDFIDLVRESGAQIESALALSEKGRTRPMNKGARNPNLFARGAIFVLTKR